MTILRGAIDLASPTRITGWIHSDHMSVTGLTALAMVDGQCVGSGPIDIYRPDLADAGLGDGRIGFDLQITLSRRGDEGRVLVKLDGNDFVLLQALTRIERADALNGAVLPSFRSAASLEWMRSRGWLEQTEIDLLKSVEQFGVYDRSLRLSKAAEKMAGAPLLDPQSESRQLLELLRLKRSEIRERRVNGVAGLLDVRRELLASSPEPTIGIWAPTRLMASVVEGSHRDMLPQDHGLDGAIDYAVGADRLLLLDLRCRFGPRYEDQQGELHVYYVAPERSR